MMTSRIVTIGPVEYEYEDEEFGDMSDKDLIEDGAIASLLEDLAGGWTPPVQVERSTDDARVERLLKAAHAFAEAARFMEASHVRDFHAAMDGIDLLVDDARWIARGDEA